MLFLIGPSVARSDDLFADVWTDVRNELSKRFPALNEEGTQFQFVHNASVANWDNNTQYNTYVISDTAPRGLGQFYSPGSSKISKGYGVFLESLKNSDKPSITAAKAAYASSINWQSVVMPDGGGTTRVPNITITPSLNAQLPKWRSMTTESIHLKVARPAVSKKTAPDVHFFRKLIPQISSAADGGNVDAPQSADSPSLTAAIPLRPVDVSESNPVSPLQSMLHHVRFSFVALETFQIGRGNWWDGTTVQIYRRGPYVDDGLQPEFFGKQGLLKLLPQEIIVSFKASMTMTISDATYQAHKQDIHDPNGVAIGPWILGGADKVLVERGSAAGTVEVTMFSKDQFSPYVVGILSNVFVIE